MNTNKILELLDRVRPTISKLEGRKISTTLLSQMNKAAGERCFLFVGRAIVFITPTGRYVLYNGYDCIAEHNSYGKIVGNDLFPALFDHLKRKILLNQS